MTTAIGSGALLKMIEKSWREDSPPDKELCLALSTYEDTTALTHLAAALRDNGHSNVITYSPKLFLPLTQLCRDVCHYCTFAKTPKRIEGAYMSIDQVLSQCREAEQLGCREALLTLGEKPELRYSVARKALNKMGYKSTLEYVEAVAGAILEKTDMLPHINAGCMSSSEIIRLRRVSASIGIMLESTSERLCGKGMPHYGSPDKNPARRLETIALAGQAAVPFTSGILVGIGETRNERIESLLELRSLNLQYNHLQEVIIQNFRAKRGTLMAESPEPDLNELLWTIAVARLLFGPEMNIQAPPNLSPGVLPQLVDAGINDWGGVSPLTQDYVNPEAPWPHLAELESQTRLSGKYLEQRLTIFPRYVQESTEWLNGALEAKVVRLTDSSGFARRDSWAPGQNATVPDDAAILLAPEYQPGPISTGLASILERCRTREQLDETSIVQLFEARGDEFVHVVRAADALRSEVCGDTVTYVVNRNINYTNVCNYKCQFCAFSKGKHNQDLRGKPYDIGGEEIARRCREAWARGATEICMQGGIHPDYTGQTYLDMLHTVKSAVPEMHIHAYSPLEVAQGAATLGLTPLAFLRQLREAGLNTLPGTSAEILHDEVRDVLCPDKLSSQEWLAIMEAAHEIGFKTTATIMYGHIDRSRHWARHLLEIRRLQEKWGGFTEFVPLPFVHMEAPMYIRGRARRGPSFREAVLMHAVARLVFHGLIDNIQVSWVKMGKAGVNACLRAGANDLGGTLMNESITRAAGSIHGQECTPAMMERLILEAERTPRQRTTLYDSVTIERGQASHRSQNLVDVYNQPARKRQSSKRLTRSLA